MLSRLLKQKLTRLTLRLLLSYLELTVNDKDTQAEEWLAASWMTPGFRKYLGYREGRLIFELSGGSNMTEIGRETYIRHMGSRLEILALGVHAKNAHIRTERTKKQKIAAQAAIDEVTV